MPAYIFEIITSSYVFFQLRLIRAETEIRLDPVRGLRRRNLNQDSGFVVEIELRCSKNEELLHVLSNASNISASSSSARWRAVRTLTPVLAVISPPC